MNRPDARGLVELVLDPGSWTRWDRPPVDPVPPGSAYARVLAEARARTGYDESVLTGEGLLHGRRVALAVCEFSFLAGSIGVAAAERLVRAIERATAQRLPLLAAPASGGTRMQEGALAFAHMVKISGVVARHRAAGLPYLVYLRHPTTGGVFASWGSLGHLTAAEPGALIGFLGPRVYETLHGRPFPEGVQVAENLLRHGIVDAVVPPERIGAVAAGALDVLAAGGTAPPRGPDPEVGPLAPVPAWESVARSRRADRPGVRAVLRHGAHGVSPLSGTGEGEIDPGLMLALARFGSAPCVVLGQDPRGRSPHGQPGVRPLGPAGLRVARRGMRLAQELRLPLVTVVDTPGAALTKDAEEGGLAAEIARCLADLAMLRAPTVCLLLGQGVGGAALALLPADRVICAQHGWLSPLPPEGVSAILHRDTAHAAEMAERQRVRSVDLLADGVVDRVVPEHPDAADEPEEFCRRVARVLEYELIGLMRRDTVERVEDRLLRYRRLGLRTLPGTAG